MLDIKPIPCTQSESRRAGLVFRTEYKLSRVIAIKYDP